MRERKIEVAIGNFTGVSGVVEPRLLGEGIGIQPVDQPLAPGGDDRGLRIMDMGIDETRQDQVLTVIRNLCIGIVGAKPVRGAGYHDASILHRNSTMSVMDNRLGWIGRKGI